MKCTRLFLCVICSLFFTLPVYALTSRTGDAISVAADEIIDDDIIIFGQNVDVSGTVLGDVYAFGQSVKITGNIGGSIFTGGANITVDAKSVESVWAAGGTVEVLGNVIRNAVLAGGSICFCDGASVGKDLGV